jgi:hypothetical protein
MKKALLRVIAVFFCLTVVSLLSAFFQPAKPAYADETTTECWAVIVGVSDYQSVTDLRYSDDDALDLAGEIDSYWGEDHINLLVNSQATKTNVMAAIKWLTDNAAADDIALFFFSGHSRSGSLCVYDSSQFSAGNDISSYELRVSFSSLRAERFTVILDVCDAGVFQSSLANTGRVIMMASRSSEDSWEIGAFAHGVFSNYILQAFYYYDTVDTNHDYELSAEEIAQYAEGETDAWVGSVGQTQHPVIVDSYSGELGILEKFVFSTEPELPSGAEVLVLDGKSYTYVPSSIIWKPGLHILKVPQTVTKGEGTRYFFVSWNDGDASVTRTILRGAYTAKYATEHRLTVVSLYGGTQGDGWYKEGEKAVFSVTPFIDGKDTRRYFTTWSGSYTGDETTASVVMNAPKTVTASWRTEYLLTVSSDYDEPAGSGWYKEGSTASISITPYLEGPDTRHYFTRWSGSYTGDSAQASFTMTAPKTVKANWRHEYLLTIDSDYGQPAGSGWYKEGATADISITPYLEEPDAKHYFTGWSGNYTGDEPTASLVMNNPKTVAANWRHEYLLTINSEYGQPTGSGWYQEGETASVAVKPVQGIIIRHKFTGWSGDLSAAAASATLTVDSPKVISANWRADYIQLYILIAGIVVLVLTPIIVLVVRRKKSIV